MNKGRKRADYRLQRGDSVRIPPIRDVAQPKPVKSGNLDWLRECVLYEDDHILALNKTSILSVRMPDNAVLKAKITKDINRAKVRIGGKPASAEITMAYLEKTLCVFVVGLIPPMNEMVG